MENRLYIWLDRFSVGRHTRKLDQGGPTARVWRRLGIPPPSRASRMGCALRPGGLGVGWDALEDIAEGKQQDGSELAECLS